MATKTPEKNMSFKLNPTTAIKLKQSIAALSDSKFNPQGVGMVEITDDGFGITVSKVETNTFGKLFLNSSSSSGLIDFHCNNPIVGKTINLTQILENFTDGDGTITVSHLDGSTHLSFIFGGAATEELKVDFLEKNAEFEKFPKMEICCETVLKTEILSSMIEMLTRRRKLVSVGISNNLVTLNMGRRDFWSVTIKEDDENFEARVFTDAKDYQGWLRLKHLEAMKKASIVGPKFELQFSADPTANMVIRFNFEEEVGELVFVHKAMLIMKNPGKYDIGTNFENTSEVLRLYNDIKQQQENRV